MNQNYFSQVGLVPLFSSSPTKGELIVTETILKELKVWYKKFTKQPLGQNPSGNDLLEYYFPQLQR
jgi:hypothetical protein